MYACNPINVWHLLLNPTSFGDRGNSADCPDVVSFPSPQAGSPSLVSRHANVLHNGDSTVTSRRDATLQGLLILAGPINLQSSMRLPRKVDIPTSPLRRARMTATQGLKRRSIDDNASLTLGTHMATSGGPFTAYRRLPMEQG